MASPESDDDFMTLARAKNEVTEAARVLQAAEDAVAKLQQKKAQLQEQAHMFGPSARHLLQQDVEAAEKALHEAKKKYVTGRVDYGGVSQNEATAELEALLAHPTAAAAMASQRMVLEHYKACAAARTLMDTARTKSADILKELARVEEELGVAQARVAGAQAVLDSKTRVVQAWSHATTMVSRISASAPSSVQLRVPTAAAGVVMDLFSVLAQFGTRLDALEVDNAMLKRENDRLRAETNYLLTTNPGEVWTQVCKSAPWSPRCDSTLVTLPCGDVLLLGGRSAEGAPHDLDDVWRSTDEGRTWTLTRQCGLAMVLTARKDVRAAFSIPTVVLPNGDLLRIGWNHEKEYHTVSRSRDEGRSWEVVQIEGKHHAIQVNGDWKGRLKGPGVAAVCLPGGDVLVLGGSTKALWADDMRHGGMYRRQRSESREGCVWGSSDGGKTWEIKCRGSVVPRQCAAVCLPNGHVLAVSPAAPPRYDRFLTYISGDRGVTWSQTWSQTWNHTWNHATQVVHADKGALVALPDGKAMFILDQRVCVSDDGGLSWRITTDQSVFSHRRGICATALPNGSVLTAGGSTDRLHNDVWLDSRVRIVEGATRARAGRAPGDASRARCGAGAGAGAGAV